MFFSFARVHFLRARLTYNRNIAAINSKNTHTVHIYYISDCAQLCDDLLLCIISERLFVSVYLCVVQVRRAQTIVKMLIYIVRYASIRFFFSVFF